MSSVIDYLRGYPVEGWLLAGVLLVVSTIYAIRSELS